MKYPRVIRRLSRTGILQLIAFVGVSAVVIVVASLSRAAEADADARVQLRAAIVEEHSAIDRVSLNGTSATAAGHGASDCLTRVSERLAEVADGDPKLPGGSVDLAARVVESAAQATPPRAFVVPRTTPPSDDADLDELRVALAESTDTRQHAVESLEAVAAGALDTAAECAEARVVLRAFVDGVRTRTDELLAANPKAATEAISALQAAQVAVAVGDAGAATRWAAAAVAIEASHSAAVKAEADAAPRWQGDQRSDRTRPDAGGFELIDPETFLAECQASAVCNPRSLDWTAGSD